MFESWLSSYIQLLCSEKIVLENILITMIKAEQTAADELINGSIKDSPMRPVIK